MSRRSVLAAVAVLLALSTAPAGAVTRALLVGIDDYAAVPKLEGAVNDVRDVEAVLKAEGVETRVLTDADATREAVVGAFQAMIDEGAAGDTLYLHFSGHGISIPDDDGDEADGRDESYLLQGFDEVARPDQQLVDDDLDALFRQAAAKGREVLFVADACHSGSPARAVAAASLPTRLYRPKLDPTRPTPIAAPTVTPAERSEILVAGATLDDKTIPEILIDGRPRGALSYATARALEGGADLDRDGVVTAAEFELFVRQTVRTVAASKQTPQFEMADGTRRILAIGRDGTKTPLGEPSSGLPPTSVYLVPGQAADTVAGAVVGQGVDLAASAETAALILDPATGTAFNPVRDVVASGLDPAKDFPRVIETQRVLDALGKLALGGTLSLSLSPDDGVQPEGRAIGFEVAGLRQPYLTVFDLTATGSVHLLWPAADGDPDPWPLDRVFRLDAAVTPPFGADTLVVVATAEKPETLRAALSGAEAGVQPATVLQGLRKDLAGKPYQIGLQAFFTAPEAPK